MKMESGGDPRAFYEKLEMVACDLMVAQINRYAQSKESCEPITNISFPDAVPHDYEQEASPLHKS